MLQEKLFHPILNWAVAALLRPLRFLLSIFPLLELFHPLIPFVDRKTTHFVLYWL